MEMLRKSWGVPLSRAFVWLLLPSVVTAAVQLPPEIQADRYLLQAERAIQEQDFQGAKTAMDGILELQGQHDLELPEPFSFRYAEVLERLGIYDEAIEFVTRYLTLAGRDGEFYREALELLNDAEAAASAAAEAARREAEEARRVPGETRVFDGMELVWVPAGEFRMGSVGPEADDDEQPLTQVRISRGFWLGKYEVTQAEWLGVMGTNPSEFSGCGPSCPVEQVSWDEVQDFIARLNAVAGEERYRLPTEAEWEYAARAGTIRDRYSEDLDAIAWYDGNSENQPHPVGQKEPNAWGLYDMLGNVQEWVQDWIDEYPGGYVTDPQGPGFGSGRGIRGGSWWYYASGSRAAFRADNSPGERYDNLGCRLLGTE